jgi:hypothetical protein
MFYDVIGLMAVGTVVVVHLRAPVVIGTGGKIHIVMAGTAGLHGRNLLPVIPVGGVGVRPVMALGAVADILRIDDMRVVVLAVKEPPDGVLSTSFYARQVFAIVDLMNHDLEIYGITAMWIRASWIMAGHTIGYTDPMVAVKSQVDVTFVTGGADCDVAMVDNTLIGFTVRRSEVKMGTIRRPSSRCLNAQAMGQQRFIRHVQDLSIPSGNGA